MTEAAPMDHMTVPYPEFVAALVKDGDQIKREMTGRQAHLLHMAVGVAGEAAELVECVLVYGGERTNFVEEMGDLEFFLEGIRAEVGIMREQTLPPAGTILTQVPFANLAPFLAIGAGRLLDTVKKEVIYQKGRDIAKLVEDLSFVETYMTALYGASDVTRDEALIDNRVKLGKRYKKLAYTNEAAQAREDKAGEANDGQSS